MTKYYKITFTDGEEWKCFTDDNIEYKSHGIMWTSSLTKASIPLLQVLETLSNPLDDKMVESMVEIDCGEYWKEIEALIYEEYDGQFIELDNRKIELAEERYKLIKQVEVMNGKN